MAAGSFGTISIATSKKKGIKVALKKMDAERIQQFNKTESVIRERDLLFDMKHANIVRINHSFKVSIKPIDKNPNAIRILLNQSC